MSNFKLDKSSFRKNVLQADWMKEEMEKVANSRKDADSHLKTFIGFDRAKSIIYPNKKGTSE